MSSSKRVASFHNQMNKNQIQRDNDDNAKVDNTTNQRYEKKVADTNAAGGAGGKGKTTKS